MATEMVLVPKTRYEKLLVDDKTYTDKLRYYETLLSNNGIDLANRKANVTPAIMNKETNDNNDPASHDDSNMAPSTTNKTLNDVATNDKDVMDDSSITTTTPNQVISNKPIEPPMTIIEKFPRQYRLYAKRLLEYITKNGLNTISWDNDASFIYKGVLMKDTNIVDLVKHIFKRIGSPPKGIKKFKKGLDIIRMPKVFLKPFLIKPPGVPSKVKKNWITY
jgi:hypothetical protein